MAAARRPLYTRLSSSAALSPACSIWFKACCIAQLCLPACLPACLLPPLLLSVGLLLLPQTFDRFKFNCIFDLPLFFCRGADRMRVLSNLLSVPFAKVTAEPKLVSVQMLNNRWGRRGATMITASHADEPLMSRSITVTVPRSKWFCSRQA
jgi:hypothetical protein